MIKSPVDFKLTKLPSVTVTEFVAKSPVIIPLPPTENTRVGTSS